MVSGFNVVFCGAVNSALGFLKLSRTVLEAPKGFGIKVGLTENPSTTQVVSISNLSLFPHLECALLCVLLLLYAPRGLGATCVKQVLEDIPARSSRVIPLVRWVRFPHSAYTNAHLQAVRRSDAEITAGE